jgi:alpha-tubulin suppressor-like RCC1 family protein
LSIAAGQALSEKEQHMTLSGLTGTTYTLDPSPVGSGGEGDVYRAYADVKIAKIYKADAFTAELEEKLKVMISHPPNESVLSQVAWPLDLLYDDKGKCSGFIMSELEINAELGEIYKYPSTTSISAQQKVNIAKNICVVVYEVHKAGYVIGDFNPRNIGLDVNTGLVSFLDTDSYHVVDSKTEKTYRCNVCASGYAAPELLKKCSDYAAENPSASKNAYAMTPLPTFTQETDNFALAIHMFKMLMNGYTPFGGVIETVSVSQSSPGVGDSAIRRDSYCFKPGYKPQSVAIPMLDAFPDEIAALFTRAFIEGKTDPSKRPTAVEWHDALVSYEKELVTCAHNPLHQYDRKNDICPFCEADKRYSDTIAQSTSDRLVQTAYAPPPKVANTKTGTVKQTVNTAAHTTTTQAKTQSVNTNASSSSKPVKPSTANNTKSSSRANPSAPVLRIGTNKQTIAICSGHSAALTANGELWAWGNNIWGQLGVSYAVSSRKGKVNLSDVISVATGFYHTIALKSDGELTAWGSNSRGQIGVGSSKARFSSPQKILTNVASVSAGCYYSLALKLDGSLWAWGSNKEGQLGDKTTTDKFLPIKIMDNIISFSAGENHTVAISSDGTLYTWGNNNYGQLGNGTSTGSSTPIKIMDNAIYAVAGKGHTMAITGGGQLWIWGWNKYGQLGTGITNNIYSPTRLINGIDKLSAGSAYSVAITSDGNLLAWGCNQDGELGDGTTTDRLYPVWIMDNIVDVVAGDVYTMAVKGDGTLWAWGFNKDGRLGDGSNKNRLAPIKIMDNIMLP